MLLMGRLRLKKILRHFESRQSQLFFFFFFTILGSSASTVDEVERDVRILYLESYFPEFPRHEGVYQNVL